MGESQGDQRWRRHDDRRAGFDYGVGGGAQHGDLSWWHDRAGGAQAPAAVTSRDVVDIDHHRRLNDHVDQR
jgi:hypothetical protein